MAEMSNNTISKHSIRSIAESCGIESINQDCCQVIADEVNARLMAIIQDSIKFKRHSRRSKLTHTDIDLALKLRNIQPVYGFATRDFIPFRYASGNGRSVHFHEDTELDLTQYLKSRHVPKVSLDSNVRSHWLAIEGVQPLIQENPDYETLLRFKSMSPNADVDDFIPRSKPPQVSLVLHNDTIVAKKKTAHDKEESVNDPIFLKLLSGHELSLEQQLHFREITEACVSTCTEQRKSALDCLQNDAGCHQLVPYFSKFILEGIRSNILKGNGTIIIYVLHVMNALLQNEAICLEQYLHELLPVVLSCVVNKQVATSDMDIRLQILYLASSLIVKICRNRTYNSDISNVQSRITKIMTDALQNEALPIHTHYGALYLITKLCNENGLKFVVLPILKKWSNAVKNTLKQVLNSNDVFAEKLKELLQTVARTIPIRKEHVNIMQEKYGYLGYIIRVYHDGQIMEETNSKERDSDVNIESMTQTNIEPTATQYISSRLSSLASELNDTASSNLSDGSEKMSKYLRNQVDEVGIDSSDTISEEMINDQDIINEGKHWL